MTRLEILDLIALCACKGASIRQMFNTVREVRTLLRHGKGQNRSGFRFRGLEFECINPHHFAFLFTEIFVAEPYWFQASSPDPRIIDGGVNIGLSVAYFKQRFPLSRIVGFEPHPDAYRVACNNVSKNRWDNVIIHNAALAADAGTIKLSFLPEEIMASTIGNRLEARGEMPQSIPVRTERLSSYLDSEVDFLKLDIEGAEDAVLAEAGHRLRHVRNMFVEFHQTRGDTTNSLSRCVSTLSSQGFDFLITSTLSTRKSAAVAPLKACGPVSSLSIFARRID